jgi:hypothetical protein
MQAYLESTKRPNLTSGTMGEDAPSLAELEKRYRVPRAAPKEFPRELMDIGRRNYGPSIIDRMKAEASLRPPPGGFKGEPPSVAELEKMYKLPKAAPKELPRELMDIGSRHYGPSIFDQEAIRESLRPSPIGGFKGEPPSVAELEKMYKLPKAAPKEFPRELMYGGPKLRGPSIIDRMAAAGALKPPPPRGGLREDPPSLAQLEKMYKLPKPAPKEFPRELMGIGTPTKSGKKPPPIPEHIRQASIARALRKHSALKIAMMKWANTPHATPRVKLPVAPHAAPAHAAPHAAPAHAAPTHAAPTHAAPTHAGGLSDEPPSLDELVGMYRQTLPTPTPQRGQGLPTIPQMASPTPPAPRAAPPPVPPQAQRPPAAAAPPPAAAAPPPAAAAPPPAAAAPPPAAAAPAAAAPAAAAEGQATGGFRNKVKAVVDDVVGFIGDQSPQVKSYLTDLAKQFNITDSTTLHNAYEYIKQHGTGAGAMAGLAALVGGGAFAHRKGQQAMQNAMLAAGGIGLAGGLIGGLATGGGGRGPGYYPQPPGMYPGRYAYASDYSSIKENPYMNFHTKMAAAASYELGVKIAQDGIKLALDTPAFGAPVTDADIDLMRSVDNARAREKMDMFKNRHATPLDLASLDAMVEEGYNRHGPGPKPSITQRIKDVINPPNYASFIPRDTTTSHEAMEQLKDMIAGRPGPLGGHKTPLHVRAQIAAGKHGPAALAGLAGLAGLSGAAAGGHHLYKQHQRQKLMKRLAMGGAGAAALAGGGLLARHLMNRDDE